MCNAYNHPINCTCGWGGDGHNGGNIDSNWNASNLISNKGTISSYQPDYFSFTNPNATCPICGCKVYYYQNCYGSKVFFDELGKPWTKHACLTNEKISSLKFDKKELIVKYDEYNLSTYITPIQLIKCEKEGRYYRILVKINQKVNSFYVQEQLFPMDILLLETKNESNYIVGFRDTPMELKLYKKNEIEK
jgi:hypothetical protein